MEKKTEEQWHKDTVDKILTMDGSYSVCAYCLSKTLVFPYGNDGKMMCMACAMSPQFIKEFEANFETRCKNYMDRALGVLGTPIITTDLIDAEDPEKNEMLWNVSALRNAKGEIVCSRHACSNLAKNKVYLKMRPGPGPAFAYTNPLIFVCDDHVMGVTWRDLVPDQAWDAICKTFVNSGRVPPRKAFTTIEIDPL